MKRIVLLGTILVLALVLRIPHLNDSQYGTDEDSSIRNAQLIMNTDLAMYLLLPLPAEVNPPLFFHILALGLSINNSVIMLKILMVLIGILGIIVFYFFSKTFFDEKFALFSTFFYAILPLHIVYSQHIRVYIWLFLLFPLSLVFLYHFITKNSRWNLIFLGITWIISFYSHYYSSLFILGEFMLVVLLYFIYRQIKIRIFLLASSIALVAVIPAILMLIHQFTLFNDLGGTQLYPVISPLIVLYPLWKYSVTADVSTTFIFFPYLAVLFPLLVGLFAYGINRVCKQDFKKALFLGLSFIFPYTVYAFAGLILPVFSFRYIMFLLPLYVLLWSWGLFSIKPRWLKFAVIGLIVLGFGVLIYFYYTIVTMYLWAQHIAV